ncbi:putative transporter [Wickerhamomyces ciferrii]|uniref:Transporter n=1 Tax=Wickerhamomyces ciferrii (strain ATCC 14091 / BCRC 22168 / CBS 111 / JCM 3599 / NBRC 0793 / NRRL Y-1031 F-60-10) TaxID=1206466 RepID=K0KPA0_WICCF|nr:putative transporter [Wickerhamomyces ciferrii]CCH42963.1 putative transporter [Wickerhamomyces ciferrii]
MSSNSVPLGDIIYTAVKPIFKIYIIIFLGFLIGRKNILTVQTARTISDMVLFILLPSLIFNKIVTNIQNSDIKQIGIIVLICLCLFSMGAIFALLSHYFTRGPRYWRGGSLMVGLCPNISDLPIAYMTTFAGGIVFNEEQGEKGIAYICMFTMVQILMQFNLGTFKLIAWDFNTQLQEDSDIENNPKEMSTTQTNQSSISSSSSSRESFDQEQNQIIPLENLQRSSTSNSQHSSHSTQSIRRQRSQSIHDVINEYSESERIRSGKVEPIPGDFTDLTTIPTKQPPAKGNWKTIPKRLFWFFLDNFTKPVSLACTIGIIISMIPWVKALFVKTNQTSLPNAPDQEPPLSFIMDFTGYLGQATVPLGLLILGSTLSRLEVKSLGNFKIWSTPLALTFIRLILLPIIGVLINTRLSKIGWYKDDEILQFICTMVFGLPNATSLIYITAFFTPLEGDFKQMDYLALTYILEYPILAISLPFLTTYTVKVCLGM